MLRELCYDQDLFILQRALITLDPNLVFVSILDHTLHGILLWRNTAAVRTGGPRLSNVVKELFYVLIAVASEEVNATKIPLPAKVHREIIHALAMGPCSYTGLTKRVAECRAEDVCFEHALSKTVNVKAPESTADFGMYANQCLLL